MRAVVPGHGFRPSYLEQFRLILDLATATDRSGKTVDTNAAIGLMAECAARAIESENRTMFVGNGGSASIASHMAIDYTKAGGLRPADWPARHRLHRRSKSPEAGKGNAGNAYTGCSPGVAACGQARLGAPARLELRRRNYAAAKYLSRAGRSVHHPRS